MNMNPNATAQMVTHAQVKPRKAAQPKPPEQPPATQTLRSAGDKQEWTPLVGDDSVIDMGRFGKITLGTNHTRKICAAHSAAHRQLLDQVDDFKKLIRRLLNELPRKRDWLDPQLEQMLRNAAAPAAHMDAAALEAHKRKAEDTPA